MWGKSVVLFFFSRILPNFILDSGIIIYNIVKKNMYFIQSADLPEEW